MGGFLSTLDICIFFGSLLVVMGLGLWAGWREDTSDDYFLAGHTSRWWGVAGSIFGSNVSANHIIGMMGVGFAAGFAMSHFEITAIAGLLLLCYGFLPVYRKLNVYTLSDYLGRRYGESSRVLYAIIMLLVIVVIQIVPGFYIGSRALNTLIHSGETATAKAVVNTDGTLQEITFTPGRDYANPPTVEIALPPDRNAANLAKATAEIGQVDIKDPDGEVVETATGVTAIKIDSPGAGYDPEYPPAVTLDGGAEYSESLAPGQINPQWYMIGIILMAVVTGTYTILGGLKAVIVTDVLQSILMLIAAIIVGLLIFSQPEIGGWTGMLALDSKANGGKELMHLYKPTSDAEFPWTGCLSGLMVLHFYYWGTNQFIVQRALSARTDREARTGIIAAGFFKLLIPFMSIGGGIAAFYYFDAKNIEVDKDAAFMELMRYVVAPIGFGVVGLVAAGVVGAILSSVDSMLNSGATIITFDVYKRYINPKASEKGLVWMGRACVVVFIAAAATLTIFTMDPNSKDSFFIHIATHQSKLIAGVVVAFALGMFWKRATSLGATLAIIAGVAASYAYPIVYDGNLTSSGDQKMMRGYTGTVKIVETEDEKVRFYQGGDEASPGYWNRHYFTTGEAVRFAGGIDKQPAASPKLEEDATYYVRTIDAYALTLHASKEDAQSDQNPIKFITNGDGPQKLYLDSAADAVATWGPHLNFMHSVFLAAVTAFLIQVIVSLLSLPPPPERGGMTWTGVGGHNPAELNKTGWKVVASIGLFALLGWLMVQGNVSPMVAGLIAAGWTWLMFLDVALISVVLSYHGGATDKDATVEGKPQTPDRPISLLEEDRFWGGLLGAVAVFMMFYFY